MAIVRAVKSGNWSDTTVWNTGALPTSADDVYSNTFTVTIDISPTVLSISNAATTGVTAGGGFDMSANGLTVTCTGAGFVSGSSAPSCFTYSGIGTATIIGNCTGGTSNNTNAAVNSSSGTLNIIGNCTGGNTGGTAAGANNTSTGIINITGNCIGGNNTPPGANNSSTGTLNITGNCTGGSSSGPGANNASTGTLNIIGNCTGGSGSTAYGAINASAGILAHIGTAQASANAAAIGVGAIGQVTTLTGPLISSSTAETSASASGANPVVALRWFPADTALTTFTYTMRGATVSGSPSSRPARVLSLPQATANAYPAVSDVRSGTIYGVGNAYTGTMSVPAATSVASGVPVDNTTGTAIVTTQNIIDALAAASAVTFNQPVTSLTTPGSIGVRLKLSSTIATTAQQLSDALSNE